MKERQCQAGGVSDERSKRQPITKSNSDGREKGEGGTRTRQGCNSGLAHRESLRFDAFVDLVRDARGAGHVRGVALGELAQGLGALLCRLSICQGVGGVPRGLVLNHSLWS